MTSFTGVATDAAANAVANGATAPVVAITIGASPFSYAAPSRGAVNVVGGTVSSIALSRNKVSTTLNGVAGVYPVSGGDSLVVTYSVVPTAMQFIPL